MIATLPDARPANDLLDTAAVAERRTCSVRHVRRMTKAGRMPHPRRMGRVTRWHLPEIEQWIAAGCPAVGE